MKIKIQTLDNDIIKLDEPDWVVRRIPIVGEQVKLQIGEKDYKFNVSNIIWDFILGEVIIEVS